MKKALLAMSIIFVSIPALTNSEEKGPNISEQISQYIQLVKEYFQCDDDCPAHIKELIIERIKQIPLRKRLTQLVLLLIAYKISKPLVRRGYQELTRPSQLKL